MRDTGGQSMTASSGKTSTGPPWTLDYIMRLLRDEPKLWHTVPSASKRTKPQQHAHAMPQSPAAHISAHQLPGGSSGGITTSAAKFPLLPLLPCLPVVVVDHTPSGSAGRTRQCPSQSYQNWTVNAVLSEQAHPSSHAHVGSHDGSCGLAVAF